MRSTSSGSCTKSCKAKKQVLSVVHLSILHQTPSQSKLRNNPAYGCDEHSDMDTTPAIQVVVQSHTSSRNSSSSSSSAACGRCASTTLLACSLGTVLPGLPAEEGCCCGAPCTSFLRWLLGLESAVLVGLLGPCMARPAFCGCWGLSGLPAGIGEACVRMLPALPNVPVPDLNEPMAKDILSLL
jgi:hypothetical protein